MSWATAGRRAAGLTALLCMLALAFSSASHSQVGDPDAFGPSYKYCKEFRGGGYTISVYAKRISCKKARAIQRELWNGPRSRKIIRNGGSGASGYILLKRYPGWRCGSGAGGGSCNKGKASAAYQN